MTTTVIIKAHCTPNKQVHCVVTDFAQNDKPVLETFVLQDGETAERTVYDGRNISVLEVLK